MMRRRITWLALLSLAACGEEPGGILLDISSEVVPLDRLTVTVLAGTGALLVDRDVPEEGGPPDLPGMVRIDAGLRDEPLRVLAWGWQDGARVAFGRTDIAAAPDLDRTFPLRLAPPPDDTDGDAVPDPFDGCPLVSDPQQEDSDADGTGDACAAAACDGNLVVNGDFEAGTTGWTAPDSGEIIWEVGGHGSDRAVRVCKSDTGGPSLSVLSDDPSTVTDPALGATYHLEAWARADAEDAPQNLRPRLRERDASGNEVFNNQNTGISLSPDWQLLSLDGTIMEAGSSALEVYFSSIDAPDGTCFVMDDICLLPVE